MKTKINWPTVFVTLVIILCLSAVAVFLDYAYEEQYKEVFGVNEETQNLKMDCELFIIDTELRQKEATLLDLKNRLNEALPKK